MGRNKKMNKQTHKKSGYFISVLTSNDGKRKPLKGNSSGKWEPISFSTRSQAQKEIDSMTPDTIRVYQPQIERM